MWSAAPIASVVHKADSKDGGLESRASSLLTRRVHTLGIRFFERVARKPLRRLGTPVECRYG